MAILRVAASRAIVVCTLFLASAHAIAEPQNGWWWNPNESGRGYFIEMTGGVLYLAGYFYDSDGRATWMSAGGAVTDLYSISGTLQSYRNGQSVFGAYRRPDAAVDVGPITITFKDDSHGTMTWPGGTVPIERQIFDTDEVLVDLPKTGWWWNPAESGSGYSVEIQGNTAFVVAFMYDESGNPIWYLTAGAMDSPTHFEGDWLEYAGGQTMAGPYRAPTSRHLGRIAIDFAAINQGTITFTEGATVKRLKKAPASSSKAGVRSRRSSVVPQFTGPTWTESQFWPQFLCILTRKIVTTSEAGTTGTFTTTETWEYKVRFDVLTGSLGRYSINDAESYLDYRYDTVDTSNGCTQSASREFYAPLFGELDISPVGLYYRVRIFEPIIPFIAVTDSCGPHDPMALPVGWGLNGLGSTLQRSNPYPGLPLPSPYPRPYMKVNNTHSEPGGSTIEWGLDCLAHAE